MKPAPNQSASHGQSAMLALTVALGMTALGCPIPTRDEPETSRSPEAADVVVLTLHGELTETGDPGLAFGPDVDSLRKQLRRLRQARQSKKVDKIVLRISSLDTGWAQLTELRQAIALARKAGKRVIAHLDDAGNGEYYLATAADEIVMSEASSLWLVGLSAQAFFIKGLLDKLGVEAEFLHEGKYKSAADPLTRESMSAEMKEALGALLDDTYAHLVAQVARRRKLEPKAVKALIDQSPHSAQQCQKLGLVDRLAAHRTDAHRLAGSGSINWNYGKKKPKTGTLRSLMKLLKPSRMTRPPQSPHVALVYAEGPILHGPRRKGFGAAPHVSSFRLVRVLDELRQRSEVKAVVLRVNSGGGSALASDLIWQAVKRLAEKKPVVASLGDVAASGGYYIVSAARRIYAQPATITGSIGVIGGKLSLAGLFEKIGVHSEVLTRGARADLFNLGRPWTEQERQVIKQHMARTYRQFVQRVASGRPLSAAQVREVAQGRIWSGKAAIAHKLVDRRGGLLEAVADAKGLAKLPASAKTAVYPRPRTWIERLQESLGATNVRGQAITQTLLRLFPSGRVPKLRALLLALRAWRGERTLTWMPVVLRIR